jgi:hypothetical protein
MFLHYINNYAYKYISCYMVLYKYTHKYTHKYERPSLAMASADGAGEERPSLEMADAASQGSSHGVGGRMRPSRRSRHVM